MDCFNFQMLLVFLLCLQVIQCSQSLNRLEERLDNLEKEFFSKLRTERKRRREDVKLLKGQLETVSQSCRCENTRSENPAQIPNEPDIVPAIRKAFKDEKQANTQLRNNLAEINATLVSDVKKIRIDVARNVTDTKLTLTAAYNDLIQNVTRVVSTTEQTVTRHVSVLESSLQSLKEEINVTVDNMIHDIRFNLVKNLTGIEERLQEVQRFVSQNTKSCAKQSDCCVTSNVSKSEDENQNVPTVKPKDDRIFQQCPGSDYASGLYTVTLNSNSSAKNNAVVYCDTQSDNGRWIVFQRRKDGSENFFRDWDDYNKRAQRALGRSPEEKVNGHSGSNNREPQGHNLNNFGRGPFDDVIY